MQDSTNPSREIDHRRDLLRGDDLEPPREFQLGFAFSLRSQCHDDIVSIGASAVLMALGNVRRDACCRAPELRREAKRLLPWKRASEHVHRFSE